MTIENEIETYNNALPDELKGEVEVFDKTVFYNYIRKKELEIILNLIKEKNPSKIIEIGCGAGWLSNYINNHTYHKTISFDISEKLVHTASKLNKNNDYFVGDAHNLPIKSKSVDLVIGIAILHHLNHLQTLTECKRILKKGGILLFIEPNSKDPIMAVGRKIIRLDIHTEDEAPINTKQLSDLLNSEKLVNHKFIYMFPFAFPLSYALRYFNNIRIKIIVERSLPLLHKLETIVLGTRLRVYSSIFFLIVKK